MNGSIPCHFCLLVNLAPVRCEKHLHDSVSVQELALLTGYGLSIYFISHL